MVSLKATLGFPEITGQLYSVFILYDKIDRNYTNHHILLYIIEGLAYNA